MTVWVAFRAHGLAWAIIGTGVRSVKHRDDGRVEIETAEQVVLADEVWLEYDLEPSPQPLLASYWIADVGTVWRRDEPVMVVESQALPEVLGGAQKEGIDVRN